MPSLLTGLVAIVMPWLWTVTSTVRHFINCHFTYIHFIYSHLANNGCAYLCLDVLLAFWYGTCVSSWESLRWNMSSWEQMLRHQWNRRIWDPPKMIDSLWILLICWAQNTQVSFFPNGHFQPMPFPFLSNSPSLTLLIHCSLSLSPFSFSPHSVFTCWNFT